MDTGRRDRQKVEAGAVNTHHDGLLGETREELFIVNLHINDSFLPPMTSFLRVEMTAHAHYVRMRVCVHESLSALNYLATGKLQQTFCLVPACLTIARFWSPR